MMAGLPQLLLLLGSRSQWERDVATGFARRLQGRAQIDLSWFNRDQPLPEAPPAGTAGVLCASLDRRRLAALATWALPTVNCCLMPGSPIPQVTVDDLAVGRLAANHLLGLGWRELALVGPRLPYWRVRRAAIEACAREAGTRCHLPEGGRTPDWQHGPEDSFIAWLAALPRPLGIIACNDTTALAVMLACRSAGLVPGLDAALVGADDEAALRGLLDPPLSTVAVAGEQVGRTSADLLLRLLAGAAPPPRPILVPPQGVVVRASSAGPAVTDPALAKGLRLALGHPGLNAAALIRATGLPRRTAELRFRRSLGCAPGAWLLARRLERAAHLLRSGELPVAEVARRCGWEDPAYFSRVFSRHRGCSPSAWRQG